MLKGVSSFINSRVNESRLPTETFHSSVGIYGGKLREEGGKLIYNTRGFISSFDRKGDAILRSYDDHLLGNPWELFRKHPKLFRKFLSPTTKRYRGSNQEIFENIQRLGLEGYYGIHSTGIEVKKPKLFRKGIPLQDIFRAEELGSDFLKSFDRMQALKVAVNYINLIHRRAAIGELLTNDIIFASVDRGEVRSPKLNIPDIVWNESKAISEKEKRAIDILDFFMSVGVEEFRRTKNWESVKTILAVIKVQYQDIQVLNLVRSYIKRGRLIMNDKELLELPDSFSYRFGMRNLFTKHNDARFMISNSKKNRNIFEVKDMREIDSKLKRILLDILK